MSMFVKQLKWQFILLQKNNIIGISLAVTAIYAGLLFFLRDAGNLDKILVTLVLNDPSVIGYFFIALGIYTEIKQQVLPAIFVTPVKIHQLLVSKVLSLSLIGVLCSIGLALPVKGFNFDIVAYTAGSFGICLLCALSGLIMLTFISEFLKFAMLSVPVFLVLVNIPMLQYLGGIEIGVLKYLFPIQGSLDLVDHAISGTAINTWYSYGSLIVLVPLFYLVASRLFIKKLIRQ